MKQIILTKGKVALVDDADYDWLNQWKWYASKGGNTFYAVRGVRNGDKMKFILMHREVLGIIDNEIVGDHKDHDGLNNQRENLRCATRLQNSSNMVGYKNSTSKYLGVSWSKTNKKWHSQLVHNGKKYSIGFFEDERKAAIAFNKKAIELRGEFAQLNQVA